MSKPRKKKHNPSKRHAAYSRALLHRMGAVLAWVSGKNNNACVLVNIKTGQLITMCPALGRAISDVQHDWSIYCAVFGRSQNGEEYMKGSAVIAPRCYQDQITDELSEIHTGVLKGMNANHRVGIGWIGCPWGDDISEHQAGQLFEKLGAWDNEKLEVIDAA